ncbi:MAG: class I SAM-dependent methyltransferase [Pseudomonadales bacterium]
MTGVGANPANSTGLSLQQRAEALQADGVFLGGPIRKFATVGRNQLSILLRNGLNGDSRVLDVGCGALRAGYWLIRFLDPGCYFGIEPNRAMLQAGCERIVTAPVIAAKQPRFDHNDRFDFAVFGIEFDYVIARSIWTHTSPAQVITMLEQFAATAPRGVMLASIKECPWYRRQHRGTGWVGKSHESDEGGTVRYRFSWIAAQARRLGLEAHRLDREYGQTWIRISQPGRPLDR